MSVVRDRINNPDSANPPRFRIIRPQPVPEPQLVLFETPVALRCFAMFYDHNIVLLPQYGDHDLYARLLQQENGEVAATGGFFDWPTRPTFLHDFAPIP